MTMTTTVSMTRVTNMTIEWPLQKAIDSQIMISGQFRYLATKRLIFLRILLFPSLLCPHHHHCCGELLETSLPRQARLAYPA